MVKVKVYGLCAWCVFFSYMTFDLFGFQFVRGYMSILSAFIVFFALLPGTIHAVRKTVVSASIMMPNTLYPLSSLRSSFSLFSYSRLVRQVYWYWMRVALSHSLRYSGEIYIKKSDRLKQIKAHIHMAMPYIENSTNNHHYSCPPNAFIRNLDREIYLFDCFV